MPVVVAVVILLASAQQEHQYLIRSMHLVLSTAAQFSGYSHLIAPYGSTTTITVAVATKTTAHQILWNWKF